MRSRAWRPSPWVVTELSESRSLSSNAASTPTPPASTPARGPLTSSAELTALGLFVSCLCPSAPVPGCVPFSVPDATTHAGRRIFNADFRPFQAACGAQTHGGGRGLYPGGTSLGAACQNVTGACLGQLRAAPGARRRDPAREARAGQVTQEMTGMRTGSGAAPAWCPARCHHCLHRTAQGHRARGCSRPAQAPRAALSHEGRPARAVGRALWRVRPVPCFQGSRKGIH